MNSSHYKIRKTKSPRFRYGIYLGITLMGIGTVGAANLPKDRNQAYSEAYSRLHTAAETQHHASDEQKEEAPESPQQKIRQERWRQDKCTQWYNNPTEANKRCRNNLEERKKHWEQAAQNGDVYHLAVVNQSSRSALAIVFPNGENALHRAIKSGQYHVLQFLLKRASVHSDREAILNQEDKDGNTPFDLALERGDIYMLRLLTKPSSYGAKAKKQLKAEEEWKELHKLLPPKPL